MPRLRPRFLAVLIVLAPLLMALGGGGAGPVSDTIPRPKDNFRADLTDRQGVVTRVEYLSCGGKTFFPLERGEGTLMVPFGKVRQVTFGEEAGAKVVADFAIDGAHELEGRLTRTLLCTGITEYGNYQIEVQGLSRIAFASP